MIPAPQFDALLLQTLHDRRLSGSERQALLQLLKDGQPDAQDLALLQHRVFALVRAELIDPESSRLLDWLEEVIKVLPRAAPESPEDAASEACFSPGHDCARRIASLFANARRAVDICVFTITDDRIASALLDAHRRGIALRIITDNDKAFDLGSDVDRLRDAGIPVRIDRTAYHMHHKFALFDGALLLNGSYNWTRSAADHNLENFTITTDRRLRDAFSAVFEKLWRDLA